MANYDLNVAEAYVGGLYGTGFTDIVSKIVTTSVISVGVPVMGTNGSTALSGDEVAKHVTNGTKFQGIAIRDLARENGIEYNIGDTIPVLRTGYMYVNVYEAVSRGKEMLWDYSHNSNTGGWTDTSNTAAGNDIRPLTGVYEYSTSGAGLVVVRLFGIAAKIGA